MVKIVFSSSVLLVYITATVSQCLTTNNITNETSIQIASRNLLEGSIRFSLQLLRTLNEVERINNESVSLFFSPYSIWSALVVTYIGAQGATEQEMRNLLNINDTNKIATWEALKNIHNFNLFKSNESKDASYNSANRLYFQEGTKFKDCIRKMLDNYIAFVDFKSSPDQAREIINKWVEKQTQQRIKDLIPGDAITFRTKLLIANAVYFKEAWLQPFDRQRTDRRQFITPRRKIFVTMMHTKGRFLYGKSEDIQCYALELPYNSSTLSMTILLPYNRYYGIDMLANNLTPKRLKDLLSGMYETEVNVSIPKFKIEDTYELSSVLMKMGLRTLFDSNRVDLSGFTGQGEFTADAVHHKAFIDVNEEGTEAAAATGITIIRKSRPTKPVIFTADYPFIYFIRDNLSNAILFLGTIQEPPEFETAVDPR